MKLKAFQVQTDWMSAMMATTYDRWLSQVIWRYQNSILSVQKHAEFDARHIPGNKSLQCSTPFCNLHMTLLVDANSRCPTQQHFTPEGAPERSQTFRRHCVLRCRRMETGR